MNGASRNGRAAAIRPLGERVRIVHEWLVRVAGSERILDALLDMQPGMPVSALVYDPRPFRGSAIARAQVSSSFLQRLPGATRRYQSYLPLMPLAVEQLDLGDADTIISIHHAVAKGALTRADQLHVSYVQSPMRYAWDLYQGYVDGLGSPRGLLVRFTLHRLRQWDVTAANRVDLFLANSQNAARRIWRAYRRRARVLYPPVDVAVFDPCQPREEYYLAFSRLVPYKRIDLAVEALSALRRPLVVIGDGPERARLERLAGPNVRFLGWQPDSAVRRHLQRARALIFPGEEDFGIVPVEAQAAGCPVIAYARGGALETVVEGVTGSFFAEQAPAAVSAAIEAFERGPRLEPEALRANAERFSRERFQVEFAEVMARAQALRASPIALERELAAAAPLLPTPA
ncbi:MAG TPA: glycosyltransferase [Dehalococcoidia bacterium]|nr:glycosyltransferase [Dehalococcoidia bacterium]